MKGFKEVEVDGICDGKNVFIAGIMEQIEPVGIHSGDSKCIFPPFSLSKRVKESILNLSEELASSLNILGLFNIQFAIKDNDIFVIEVNPRASRTIPYLSKSLGISLVKIATKSVLGVPLTHQNVFNLKKQNLFSMKKPVFSDVLNTNNLKSGPEMFSTGEKMIIGNSFNNLMNKSKGIYINPKSIQEVHQENQ